MTSDMKATTYSWKTKLLSQDRKLQGLLKENFDEASFLYDLYKTSTVTEVNQFKWSLEDNQKGLVGQAMRGLLEERDEFE